MNKLILIFIGSLILSGCSTTEKFALSGGLAGATVGGVVGHQYDNGLAGAGIGGAVGTATGVILAERKKLKMNQYEQGFQDGFIKGQADYARTSWDDATGKCKNKFTTVTIDGIPEGKVDGVIYEPEFEELGGKE